MTRQTQRLLGRARVAASLLAIFLLAGLALGADTPAEMSSEEREILQRQPSSEAVVAPIQLQELETLVEEEGTPALRVITEEGYFDFDEEHNRIYANRRTRIVYNGIELVADQLNVDLSTNEVEAVGNVVLSNEQGVELTAEKLAYNFRKGTGKAFRAKGQYQSMRIECAEDESDIPSFERVSKHEAIFRGSRLTGCEFSRPHYYLKAKEIVVYQNDRIFLKGVTLYVRNIPVFYLPVFTRSLREGSPWRVRVGSKSSLGVWGRISYKYKHKTEEPAFETDELVTKSEGELVVSADYFSQRGPGAGLTYDYWLNYGRHRGKVDLYFLNDSGRDVDGEENLDRYLLAGQHRSEITDDLTFTANVDWFSDPELYDEVLDLFRDVERKRVMERRARTALTLARENYVARLLIEVKDRIGRDHVSNFSDIRDDDLDFDEEPNRRIEDRDDEGIDTDRWGRASLRGPQITVATRWLKLWNLPLYYHSDLNIFNNLDRGLNMVDDDDDSFVRGFDWYNALMWRWRISERTSLLAKLGIGAGMASREDDEFGYLPDRDPFGRKFNQDEVFIIGKKEFELKDVSDGFVYGDAMLRFHSRMSDALSLDITYKYRYTTDDFLGDWYAEMGNRFVRDDLYNFRLRENNISAVLSYTVLSPRLQLALRGYQNLISDGDLYPGEKKSDYGASAMWASADNTMTVSTNVGVAATQIYHPSDPLAYIDSSFYWSAVANYRPLSGRWWARMSARYRDELDEAVGDDDFERFTESEAEFVVNGLIGGKIGPKWTAEVTTDYSSRVGSIRNLGFRFTRDLHDALLLMMLRFENDVYHDRTDEQSFADQVDFRFALQPKMPNLQGAAERIPGISVIEQERKAPAVSTTFF